MTKKIFLILAVAGMSCSLHMKAAVPPVTKDTVQLESYTDVEQMLRPLEPTYRKGVFVTSPWNGNWFVSLQGGASAFIGKPIGCADLFDRVRPTFRIARQVVHSADRSKNRLWRLAVQRLRTGHK